MSVSYDQLKSLELRDQTVSYTDRDTMLYALSVGMGRDPLHEPELCYVAETAGLRTLPSMATVLPRLLVRKSGLDMTKILHTQQKLELYGELPIEGSLIYDTGIGDVFDRGIEKGAFVHFEATARLPTATTPLFKLTTVILARGNGGIGGPAPSREPLHQMPERQPDKVVKIEIRPEQALIYRLNGDRTALHADPKIAKQAGLGKPILHGLCTYGSICRALVQTVCDYDGSRITSLDARFTSPVYPGETLELDVWQDRDVLSFRCRSIERSSVVIDNGVSILR